MSINHTRNAIRFAIVVFWIVVIGILASAISHSTNAFALGWVTWLFYAVVTIVVLYVGAVFTAKLWSFK